MFLYQFMPTRRARAKLQPSTVPLPDQVWTSSLGRRLRWGMLRRLSSVTTRSMRFVLRRSEVAVLCGAFSPGTYIAIRNKRLP